MRLSEAEREVVLAILDGRSNADIALARGRSVRTVANQAASAFRKLGVRSRSELATLWWRDGHPGPARVDTCVDAGADAGADTTPDTAADTGAAELDTSRLTRREREVVAAVARGRTNKAIAYELGLGVSTVSWYLASAMRKLGAPTRVALIRLCVSLCRETPLAMAV
jgi:DNA-binding CsgD family transcriptional regulator